MAIGNETRSEISYLGKSFRFKGNISGSEEIFIDGEVEGTVQFPGQVITVGPHGNVNAEVKARDLVVQGKLKGNAQAHDRIEVTRSGSVLGDLSMARISIQDGAFIQGRVDIHSAAHAAPPAAPASARPPAPPSPPTSASPQQTSLLEHKP